MTYRYWSPMTNECGCRTRWNVDLQREEVIVPCADHDNGGQS